MSGNESYNVIIKELKRVEAENNIDIHVPSHEGTLKFRPLSVKTQKKIIDAALNSAANNIQYTVTMNDIIMEYSNNDNILITDRPAITISMRSHSLGDIMTIDEAEVNISKLVDSYTENLPELEYKSRSTLGDVTVSMCIPDLKTDNKFLKGCEVKLSKTNKTGTAISELYVYELAKYVDSIQYKTTVSGLSGEPETKISSVRFDVLPVDECVSLVEMLPMRLNTEIVKFVTQARDSERMYVTIDDITVPTDATLFALE